MCLNVFLRFIKKYSKEDPDGLVSQAKGKMQLVAARKRKRIGPEGTMTMQALF
jgi:hypothetical protein